MFESMTLTLAQEDAAPAPAAPRTGDATTSQPLPPAGSGAAPPPQSPMGLDPTFMLILLGGLALIMIFSTRTQSKERKKRAAMIAALKKGDKVQTVGGIIGSVVEVRDNEVVLKVDENANTRIKFTRAAIQNVVAEDSVDPQDAKKA